jgi:monovalent cation:H+ antiporter-2, CPA2 family
MIEVSFLLIAAAIALGLSRWLRLPAVPLLITMGYLLATSGATPDREMIEQFLVLGLSFLVFVAGMEMSPARIGRRLKPILWVGIVQFFSLGLGGLFLALILGFDQTSALYLGLAVAASSTLVVMRLLRNRQEMFKPYGRLVVGVLLFQDLMVILLMLVLVQSPEGASEILKGLASAASLGVGVLVFAKFISPWIVDHFQSEEEILLLSILTVLFIFIGGSVWMNIPIVAGAFFAGVALSPFPIGGIARGLLNSLTDFFTAIFFTALGAILIIPLGFDLVRVLLFSLLVITLTPLIVTLVGERTGLTARNAIESGLLLAQTSEFSLIIGLQGLVIGHLAPEVFSIIALVTVLTMIITPWLATNRMTLWLMSLHPAPTGMRSHPKIYKDHFLILGCGLIGMQVLVEISRRGIPCLAVERDPALAAKLKSEGHEVLWGDASQAKDLILAGIGSAKQVIVTTGRYDHVEMVRKLTSFVPIDAHVFEKNQAQRMERLGATPILYSDAAVESFLRWFHQNEELKSKNRAHQKA